MDRDRVNEFCAGLTGTTRHDPWGGGHDVWKVGGKMFVSMGTENTGVVVKCADRETAEMLIDIGAGERPKYLTRGGWILLRWGAVDADDLRDRIQTSWRVVAAGLTKTARTQLGINL